MNSRIMVMAVSGSTTWRSRTLLIREWRGVSHRVTVLDNDVVYRKRRYKSMSEVARAITGTRWSGPLFFGLKDRAQEAANG